LSVFHALFQRYDACVVFNAANSFWLLPLRFFGKKIIINTDGLEWKRSKWGFLGKTYYRLAEIMACLISDRLISDCDGIRNYYLNKHQTDSTVIAYGAYVQECPLPKKLDQFGVQPSEYFLQITRFEPENHPLLTIQAFKKLKTDKKLILVGGVHYPSEYSRQMKEAASGCDNIILPGYVYDQELLRELWCCCHAYIHGNSVGGTNPALLQAMASGCFVLCVDVAFNRDVLKECGIFYKSNTESLVEQMQWTIDRQEELDSCRFMAVKRIELHYSWDSVAKEYETLCEDVVRGVYRWKPTVKPLLPSNKNL
jgi:glycosyltransferase involved in cell wall biosynthesis